MISQKEWRLLKQDDDVLNTLTADLPISEILARLLYNRGFRDAEKANEFMEKSESFFHNPFLLRDMDKAVSVITQAMADGNKITVYGDYDADGVTSVSILLRYFHGKGVNADFYIPSRDAEGYGLNCDAMDAIKESGTDLIITVDSGITSCKEVEYAHQIGMKVVVTDHHRCPDVLPAAEAVINPHRPDCPYPFKDLAGVGVAFKLICALELSLECYGNYDLRIIKELCKEYLELVSVGTIADVMPIVGENRIIAHLGMNLMKNTQNVGLRALLSESGLECDDASRDVTKKITSTSVSFSLAPRINAIGRLGNAGRAVQLFMTPSPILAEAISLELCDYNRERQEKEIEIQQEAEQILLTHPEIADAPVLVIAGKGWHVGVIGIVASRITEKYGKPSVLISVSDDCPDGKGSARSVAGFDIFKAFSACSDCLVKFGGHESAAGLTIAADQVDRFREKMAEYCRSVFPNGLPNPVLEIDCEIQKQDIGFDLLGELSLLEPYGAQNPSPLFLLSGVRIEEMISLTQNKHTKVMIDGRDGNRVPVLFFHRSLKDEDYDVGDIVDLVVQLDANEYRGVTSVQLTAKDIRLNGRVLDFYRENDALCSDILAGKAICPEEDYPSRDDFAAVYLSLRRIQGQGKNECSQKNLLRIHPAFSYTKIAVILSVLTDCGLLRMKKRQNGIFDFSLPPTREKMNLMDSPIMLRIRKE